MIALLAAGLLAYDLYKYKNRKPAEYSPVPEAFNYLAEHGIWYVYEEDWYEEVMYATKVVRSEEGLKRVPLHHPVFPNEKGK
mgnify:FL=1